MPVLMSPVKGGDVSTERGPCLALHPSCDGPTQLVSGSELDTRGGGEQRMGLAAHVAESGLQPRLPSPLEEVGGRTSWPCPSTDCGAS